MDISEKLLQARQAAGLSQRQLCGDYITRNMLSQLEHGTAKPSLETLQYLAKQLGKPVSYFLDEEAYISPGAELRAKLRAAYTLGDFEGAAEAWKASALSPEEAELECVVMAYFSLLALAERAISQERIPLAKSQLEQARALEKHLTLLPELSRRRILLQGKIPGQNLELLTKSLPGVDDDLYLLARAALAQGRYQRTVQLLAAVAQRTSAWYLLDGKAHFEKKEYQKAAASLKLAESDYPEVYPLLEVCYRELEDFKMAYFYACKRK